MPQALLPGSRIAVVGLGNMGLPMARRLAEAGYEVVGSDVSDSARQTLAGVPGASALASPSEAAKDAVVLMLPTSSVVRAVLIDGQLLDALAPGATLIDMGSSEPLETRALSAEAERRDIEVLDAPVSGGVRGAVDGTLTIMVGGAEGPVERARPLLAALGRNVVHVGPVGAGHALKALNNLLSATHLLASSEALTIGRRFGLDPRVMLEAINGSSGRSASTERKLPDHVLTGSYASGFPVNLMVKDMRIAVDLGAALGAAPALGQQALDLWARGAEALPPDADHTEIARWVDAVAGA
jgi:3-hydroxyisobutyrate dehydrogenase